MVFFGVKKSGIGVFFVSAENGAGVKLTSGNPDNHSSGRLPGRLRWEVRL